jgi:hypothetical protein
MKRMAIQLKKVKDDCLLSDPLHPSVKQLQRVSLQPIGSGAQPQLRSKPSDAKGLVSLV